MPSCFKQLLLFSHLARFPRGATALPQAVEGQCSHVNGFGSAGMHPKNACREPSAETGVGVRAPIVQAHVRDPESKATEEVLEQRLIAEK